MPVRGGGSQAGFPCRAPAQKGPLTAMQIRLTLLGPRGAHPARACDVLVTAPAGTLLSAVAAGLATAAQAGEGPAVLYAGTQRLDAQRAVLGEPPLVDGAVLSLGAPAAPGPTPDGSTPQLQVLTGPDAGGVHLLHGGEISLGRSAEADITLDDPDVSRTHCAVLVDEAGRVSVADPGSTNGTTLDGARVGPRPVPLPRGALLRVGESVLRVVPGAALPAAATAPDGEGHVRVRIAETGPGLGAAPGSEAAEGVPGPTAYGSGDAAPGTAYGSGAYESGAYGSGPYGSGASFDDGASHGGGALSEPDPEPYRPPAEAAPHAADGEQRGGRRRGFSRWTRRFGGRPEESAGPVPGAGAEQRQDSPYGAPGQGHQPLPASFAAQRDESGGGAGGRALPDPWPDLASLLLTALGPGTRLWERGPGHPESLVVRIGTADRTLPGGGVLAVPLTVALPECGGLGLAGPRDRLLGLARAVLSQLAALHSPDVLEIVLLSTDRGRPVEERTADWAWLGWLPQLRPTRGQDCRVLVAYDKEQAAARVDELRRRPAEGPGAGGPRTVVVLDGDPGTPALREAAAWCASDGPAAGVHLLCLAEAPAASPASPVDETFEAACAWLPAFRDCGAVALLSGEVATSVHLLRTAHGRLAGHGTVGTVDGVSAAWAERFGRALAPLRTDAAPGDPHAGLAAPLPQAARLLDELGLARATPASLLARWAAAADEAASRGGRALAVLGAGPHGPAAADLDGPHGPHLLIEGPPGSGRTELLRAVTASLAAGERPDRLGLVLIDGCGVPAEPAAGLGVCLDLPHVSTRLTAQDPVRMREFAQSLTAELKRRARLLEGTDFAAWHAGSRAEAATGVAERLVSPRAAERSEAETHGRGFGHADSGRAPEGRAEGGRQREIPAQSGLRRETRSGLPQDPGAGGTGPGQRAQATAPDASPATATTGAAPLEAPGARYAGSTTALAETYVRSGTPPHGTPAPRAEAAAYPAPRAAVRARPQAAPESAAHPQAAAPSRTGSFPHPADAAAPPPAGPAAGHPVAESVPPQSRSGHGEQAPGGDAGELDAPTGRTLRLRTTARSAEAAPDEAVAGPLPRLVVLVDDLDTLLAPPLGSTGRPAAGSVVRALEAVAREGARLGVHLVAAATRTERVAATELAQGAGLRITLDAPSAAPEDPAPGRGRLHTPDGGALPFQGGRVTGRIPRTATLRPTVLPLEWERMGDPPARRPVRELGNGPTDLALLASALDRAARSAGAQGPPPLV